jgi:hypothetical protein
MKDSPENKEMSRKARTPALQPVQGAVFRPAKRGSSSARDD